MLDVTSYLVVRSQVPSDLRDQFESWYGNDHLPRAIVDLRSTRAWRFWSNGDPAVHIAVYQCENHEQLQDALASREVGELIEEYDRMWAPRVTRTREIFELVESSRR
jgi:hypothetical protein